MLPGELQPLEHQAWQQDGINIADYTEAGSQFVDGGAIEARVLLLPLRIKGSPIGFGRVAIEDQSKHEREAVADCEHYRSPDGNPPISIVRSGLNPAEEEQDG